MLLIIVIILSGIISVFVPDNWAMLIQYIVIPITAYFLLSDLATTFSRRLHLSKEVIETEEDGVFVSHGLAVSYSGELKPQIKPEY